LIQSLEHLFENHITDLREIDPNIGENFICPICMQTYSFEDIKNKKLTRGDVWPKYIRSKSSSKILKKQIVLLCKDCNNRAGQYGDAQMQLIEQMKDGDEEGILYGRRRVQLSQKGNKNPITINVNTNIRLYRK